MTYDLSSIHIECSLRVASERTKGHSSRIGTWNIVWGTHRRSLSKSMDCWSECRLCKNSQTHLAAAPESAQPWPAGKKFKWEDMITAVQRNEWDRISLLFLTLQSALTWSECLWSVSSRHWSYAKWKMFLCCIAASSRWELLHILNRTINFCCPHCLRWIHKRGSRCSVVLPSQRLQGTSNWKVLYLCFAPVAFQSQGYLLDECISWIIVLAGAAPVLHHSHQWGMFFISL